MTTSWQRFLDKQYKQLHDDVDRLLLLDMVVYGVSFQRVDKDGKVTRIPPQEVKND
jgi:hypothetical protein